MTKGDIELFYVIRLSHTKLYMMTAQLSRNFKKAQSPHAVALKQTAEQKGDSRLHLRPRPAYICTLQYAALRYTENDSEPANKMKQPRHADTC